MLRAFDVTSSILATVSRFGYGDRIGALGARPAKTLELYEFEACPFCRKVREALTVLDLEAVIYPCPKGGPRFRPEVKRRGGKALFPYLVDPNTGVEMYESDEINRYLFAKYGTGTVPLMLSAGALTNATEGIASAVRLGGGAWYRRAKVAEKPLELWSYEGSPFCRIVREALCELEIPYLLHNVGKGSPRRDQFVERSGKMMVPYLSDPNTGKQTFESAEIVAYLRDTYEAC